MIQTARHKTDNGIDRTWLGEYAARLHHKVSSGEDAFAELLTDRGMIAVADDVILLDCSSDAERKDFTVAELAARLRDVYFTVHGMDPNQFSSVMKVTDAKGEEIQIAIPPRGEMIAWEAVARWLCYAVQADDETKAAEAMDLIFHKARQEYLSVDTNAATHPRPARRPEGPTRSAADIAREQQRELELLESNSIGGLPELPDITDDDELSPFSEFAYNYGEPEPIGADDHVEPDGPPEPPADPAD